MCPFAVDERKLSSKPGEQALVSMDLHRPPVVSIPHMDFPRIVYKHPKEPFRTIEHRNARHELVEEEIVATEHLTLTVADKEELKAALAEGWVKDPYLPQTPPSKNDSLY